MLTLSELEVVPVERRMMPGDADKLVGRMVDDEEARMPTAKPALLIDSQTQEPVMMAMPVENIAPLRTAILAAPMTTTYRSSGLTNVSRTFGMAPRKPIQWREGCAPTSLARDEPGVMSVLTDYAAVMRDQLAAILPQEVERGAHAVDAVLPEWRLADDALWTSGVINRTSQLPYHRDRFNFDAWSGMVMLRRNARGGFLHLPEYDITWPARDGWAIFFSGFRLVHGVTPIHLTKADGYRYSIVYYALKGMKDCFTAAVETTYAQQKRTEREKVAPSGVHDPNDDGDPYGRIPKENL